MWFTMNANSKTMNQKRVQDCSGHSELKIHSPSLPCVFCPPPPIAAPPLSQRRVARGIFSAAPWGRRSPLPPGPRSGIARWFCPLALPGSVELRYRNRTTVIRKLRGAKSGNLRAESRAVRMWMCAYFSRFDLRASVLTNFGWTVSRRYRPLQEVIGLRGHLRFVRLLSQLERL